MRFNPDKVRMNIEKVRNFRVVRVQSEINSVKSSLCKVRLNQRQVQIECKVTKGIFFAIVIFKPGASQIPQYVALYRLNKAYYFRVCFQRWQKRM